MNVLVSGGGGGVTCLYFCHIFLQYFLPNTYTVLLQLCSAKETLAALYTLINAGIQGIKRDIFHNNVNIVFFSLRSFSQ